MNAVTTADRPPAAVSTSRAGLLPGFGGLLRKELKEWRHGWRPWIVLIVTLLLFAGTAASAWLQTNLPGEPGDAAVDIGPLDPLSNVLRAVAGQFFVVVAIFAVMRVIVAERESGTLAWTASKPVSRSAIWLSKWVASTAVLWLLVGVLPLAATSLLVTALYGAPPAVPILALAAGMLLPIALFTAIGLAAATLINSQAGVAGVAFAILFLPQLIGGILPITEYLPTQILAWTIGTIMGQPAGWATPVSWLVTVAALATFSMWRMERMEL